MYPGTMVNWHDQSGIAQQSTESYDNSPLYLVLSSFDRGPEDLREVKGKPFYNLYGNKMAFDKHGQPAIQAANIINGGGRILVKRLVAKDATLANAIAVATVNSKINAVKADSADINAKTISEIINGESDATVEYTEVLEILSSIGSTVGNTILDVNPELTAGNKYFWKETNNDSLMVLDTQISNREYIEWDGVSEIPVADGTKIVLVETNSKGVAKKSGIITVVSKLDHPATTSINPDNDLNALYITSKEGTTVGNTSLIVSPIIMDAGNKYYYKAFDGTYPDPSSFLDNVEITDWTLWDGVSEVALADDSAIVLVEFSVEDENTTDVKYIPVKGASINVVSKLPEDTRTSESVEPIVPTEDKYLVSEQVNSVTWRLSSVTNCKTPEDVLANAKSLKNTAIPTVEYTDATEVTISKSVSFPLIVAADNGRGVSNKSIKFVPDYSSSKDMGNMFYNVYVYEGTKILENIACTLNPSAIFGEKLYGLNPDISTQIVFDVVPGVYEEYIDYLEEITGFAPEVLMKYDCMFMTNNKGTNLSPYVVLDAESVDLQSEFGVELKCGSNGEFGDAPFGTKAWIDEAINVLNGTFDGIIYDVDTYKIAAVFDANYPLPVKEAIADFVNFREDCVFFRDYGIDVFSYASIVAYYAAFKAEHKTKFILDYYTTYQIYDPETKVRERVTMMYDFSRAMIAHFNNGCYRPMAGIANNMVLPSAIKGTINFTPRVLPSVNQKALLDDARINYAIFQDDRCVVQSLYTSQEDYTQLSFGNNVLAVQEVIRSIRTVCPRQRFTFTTNNDFTSYADAVNNVLIGFRSNFKTLEFRFEQDGVKANQKIFYASLYFSFNNWAQTEVFDIYTLNE